MLHVRERVGCVVCDVCLLLCEVYVRACFLCVSVVVVYTRVCVACVLCEFVEGWGWGRTKSTVRAVVEKGWSGWGRWLNHEER